MRERLDVLSWATYMGQKLGQNAPLILGGLSMGATTVLLASCFDFPANVRAIIADCGFTSPYEIAKKRPAPRCSQSAGFASAAAVQPGYQAFAGFGLRDGSTIDAVRESRYPILFLHGTGDTFVPYEMTKRAFDACTAPKRLILVDGAEHGKSYIKEPDRVRQELKPLSRYLYTDNKGGHPMMQHEITSAAPLLDASGNLREPGWARSLLPVYCRSQIRAPKSRIKEWTTIL